MHFRLQFSHLPLRESCFFQVLEGFFSSLLCCFFSSNNPNYILRALLNLKKKLLCLLFWYTGRKIPKICKISIVNIPNGIVGCVSV